MIIEDWRSHLSWMFEEAERTGKPLAFDGYAGLGGWDDGLAVEGFLVLGCEIDPKIAELNKHLMICADFTTLNPGDFKGFDLIVGSPPCRNFTNLARLFGTTRWKNPPDPNGNGMKLVNAFLKFVEIAQPKYWCMENVPGLKRYYPVTPKCESFLGGNMKRCLWGNFPSFLVPRDLGKNKIMSKTLSTNRPSHMRVNGKIPKFEQWERARIPLPVARALGVAVKQALEVE